MRHAHESAFKTDTDAMRAFSGTEPDRDLEIAPNAIDLIKYYAEVQMHPLTPKPKMSSSGAAGNFIASWSSSTTGRRRCAKSIGATDLNAWCALASPARMGCGKRLTARRAKSTYTGFQVA